MNNQIFHHVVELVTALKETDFFEDHPFADQDILCKKLIMALLEKSSREGEFTKLDEEEFVDVVNSTIQESINETISSLSDKGAIQWKVRPGGELVISKNPDFNMDEI